MPHLERRLAALIGRGRGAVQCFARPVYSLGPEGLRRWKFDVREEDGGLDARGKCRDLDDTQSSLGKAV